ncbi:MAG: hypothetical protein H6737_16170 [Alphaproteobacteria bacterium]|nr:hypothetical protein [Alphaproteobacteria bacterium]
MSGKDDEEKLPEVARRRGNADTLFSADWFEDDDEETGKAQAAPEDPKAQGGKATWLPEGAMVAGGNAGAAPPPPPTPAPDEPAPPQMLDEPIAPQMIEEPEKPAPPAAAPPPPPRARTANPTILPDFDFDDEMADAAKGAMGDPEPKAAEPPKAEPPKAEPPKIDAPKPQTKQNEPDVLPEVAKRKGNADTLFSADWFDDDDEEKSSEPAAKAPATKKKSEPTAAPIGDDFDELDEPASGGSNMLIYIAVAGLFVVLACAGMGAGIGIVFLFRG